MCHALEITGKGEVTTTSGKQVQGLTLRCLLSGGEHEGEGTSKRRSLTTSGCLSGCKEQGTPH